MIKITLNTDITVFLHLPMEVIREVMRVMEILKENYGDYGIDGGYVLIAETKDDIELLPVNIADYEFADRIQTPIGDYVSVLYLTGTEYSVTVIIPMEIAPNIITRGVEK